MVEQKGMIVGVFFCPKGLFLKWKGGNWNGIKSIGLALFCMRGMLSKASFTRRAKQVFTSNWMWGKHNEGPSTGKTTTASCHTERDEKS